MGRRICLKFQGREFRIFMRTTICMCHWRVRILKFFNSDGWAREVEGSKFLFLRKNVQSF